MARVQVSDEVWAAYRSQLGLTPVSVALGRLVEREVASHRRRSSIDADGVRGAVEDARAVVAELANLVARLEESRAPSAFAGAGDEATPATDERLF